MCKNAYTYVRLSQILSLGQKQEEDHLKLPIYIVKFAKSHPFLFESFLFHIEYK